jgi:hypothetical protein
LEEESRDIDKPNLEQASSEEQSLEEMSTEALQNKYKDLLREYEAAPSEELQKRLSDVSIIINDRIITESVEEPKEEQKAPEPAAQQVPEPAAQQVPEPAAQQVPEPAAQQVPEPAAQVPEPAAQQVPEPDAPEPAAQQQVTESDAPEEPKEDIKSHLFAIRTTGGQEKVVLNLLQNRVKTQKVNLQSVLLVDNLKGYVVIEAIDTSQAFNAIQGIRHIRGQLRGELSFKEMRLINYQLLSMQIILNSSQLSKE